MSNDAARVRDAWRELCAQIEPNAVMTLGVNLELSPITFEGQARRLFNALQRDARGRNWHTYRAATRPRAIGFIEEGVNRPHMHIAAHLPKDATLRATFATGSSRWARIRRGGDYFFEFVDDPRAYISYITKRFHRSLTSEHVFIYEPRERLLS